MKCHETPAHLITRGPRQCHENFSTTWRAQFLEFRADRELKMCGISWKRVCAFRNFDFLPQSLIMTILKFHTFSMMHFSSFTRLRGSSDTCCTSNDVKFNADSHGATFECKLMRVPPETQFQGAVPGGLTVARLCVKSGPWPRGGHMVVGFYVFLLLC